MKAGLGITEARRRRALVEAALRSPDVSLLTNAGVARLLKVGPGVVRWGRRRLESCGAIARVDRRLNRRGVRMDVTRIGAWNRKYEACAC